ALFTLISISPRMALYASISYPIIFIYSFFFFKKVRKLFRASDEKESAMTSFLQEALSGVRVIKAFNREKYEMESFYRQNKDYVGVTYDMIKGLGSYWGFSYFICMLAILSVIVTGIFAVQGGIFSIGAFYVFITYQSRVIYQIRNLGRILSDFGKVVVSIDRLVEIKEEKTENLNEGITPELQGKVEFDHVCFHYADDESVEVLKDVSFTIDAGKTVAIIGPTGSGKSSLVNLLARLYDVTGGEIRIDGYPINSIAKGYLRHNIGIVLQEPFLFSKTIYENLRISNPDLDEKEIYHASQIASIHDVIKEFDKGYDTLVGERGVTLSGGQKQRIAIARTIVNKSPILIFDDSLSAVDTETDASIRKALHSFDKSATMIIITQRTLSAKDADFIVVIEDGRVSEIGTHEELIHKEGLYKRIYEIQSQRKGGADDHEV
ncbi:MAG: ABC transporter ATP-binding protein, partial [Erysipelotrichaceae bacterium]|nr:ABC transporter ATP-binding protein [Erysipelotrichaceae bacterium]